jgi:hypothetical protein
MQDCTDQLQRAHAASGTLAITECADITPGKCVISTNLLLVR